MKICAVQFNLYLRLLLAAGLFCGCQTHAGHSDAGQKKAPKKGYSLVRLHIETNADGTDKNGPVTVGCQSPFTINVSKDPFVNEKHLVKASLEDDGMGGFALRVQFNRQGAWLLEQYTVANKGRHIAVFAELDDFRWLAAPLITKRITDGVLTFSPDTSSEEAEKLVLGLTKAIKKERSRTSLNDPEPP